MLVLFDCDGVLVESESLAARVFSEALAASGIAIAPEDCEARFVGKTLRHCLNELDDEFPGVIGADFLPQLELATAQAFRDHLKPVAGIAPVLDALQTRGISRCVVSNGSQKKIRRSLELTGLGHYFAEAIFSAEDVENPKPAPDVIHLACESLGVPQAFSVLVEDSLTGAQAGLAAGVRVLLFQPSWRRAHPKVPAGVTVFSSMPELLTLLRP